MASETFLSKGAVGSRVRMDRVLYRSLETGAKLWNPALATLGWSEPQGSAGTKNLGELGQGLTSDSKLLLGALCLIKQFFNYKVPSPWRQWKKRIRD